MKKTALFILVIICSLPVIGQPVLTARQNNNGLWGFVDNTGKTAIPFQYEELGIKEFVKGQVTVPAKQNGLWGFIDNTGETIIPFLYEELGIKKEWFLYAHFDKGEAAIPVKKEGKWGFIDLMGRIVIPFIYDEASSYYGLRSKTPAKVSIDGKWGAIDLMGNAVVPLTKKNSFDVPDKSKVLEKNDKNGIYNLKKRQLSQARRDCEILMQQHTRLLAERQEGFEAFAKTYVQNNINEWQKKSEYEKTNEWQERVNETTRKEKISQFQKEAEKEYIAIYGKEFPLELDLYDADNETYLIKSNRYGNLLVYVPQSEAQSFKANWNYFRKTPVFFIEKDQLALAELSFTADNSKSYKYSNKASLSYASATIEYNFAPIELKIADNSSSQRGSQTITNTNVSIGKSDVDVNIPVNKSGSNKTTFAAIIANENYRRESQVEFAINDGTTFKEYCMKTLGLPENQIRFETDATLVDMYDIIDWITKVVNAFKNEANLIFYYAGHGIPDESSKTAYLLPADGYGSNIASGYKLDDLYQKLGALPAKSITIFMDACFSGTKRSGEMLASARGVALKTSQGKPSGNMVVFSAAQEDETAFPYREKGHGIFTYFLLKKLQETKGDVTLGDLGAYIKTNVTQQSILVNKKSQTPSVTPSATLYEKWENMKLK